VGERKTCEQRTRVRRSSCAQTTKKKDQHGRKTYALNGCAAKKEVLEREPWLFEGRRKQELHFGFRKKRDRFDGGESSNASAFPSPKKSKGEVVTSQTIPRREKTPPDRKGDRRTSIKGWNMVLTK